MPDVHPAADDGAAHDSAARDSAADDLAVTIRCREHPDRFIRLHDRCFPDEDGIGFAVEIRAEGLHAVHGVGTWVWEGSLPAFISGLAADFRGWPGERRWQCQDGFGVRAVFHPRGHVALTWDLQPPWRPDEWQVSMTTWLDAGEQMGRLAADLHELLPLPAPRS